MALKLIAVTLMCVVWAVADASAALRRGLQDAVSQSPAQTWVDFALDASSESMWPQVHLGVRPAVAVDTNAKPDVVKSPEVMLTLPYAFPEPDAGHSHKLAAEVHHAFVAKMAHVNTPTKGDVDLNTHKIPEAVRANVVLHAGPTPEEEKVLLEAHRHVTEATAAAVAVDAAKSKSWSFLQGTAPKAVHAPQVQGSTTYQFSSSFQYYTVPAGVSKFTISAVGGSGSSFTGDGGTGAGGFGAYVATTCTAPAGTVIQISVGGAGKGATPGTSPLNTYMAASGYGPGAPGSTDGAAGGAVTTVAVCSSMPTSATSCPNSIVYVAGGGGGDCSLAKCFSGGNGGTSDGSNNGNGIAGTGICSTSGGPNGMGSTAAYCNTNFGYSVGAVGKVMIGGKGDGGSGGQGKYGGGGGQGLGGGGGGAFGSGGAGSSFAYTPSTGTLGVVCSSSPYYGVWTIAGSDGVVFIDESGATPTVAPTPAAGTVGSISTGYGTYLTFPASDTTCSTKAVSAIYAPLGSCLTAMPVSVNGAAAIYTADSTGAIYQSAYSSSTCSGTASSTQRLPKTCTCDSYGCYQYYTYSPTIPTIASSTTSTYTIYGGSTTCGGNNYFSQRRRDGRSHQLSNQLQRHLLRRDYRQQITSGWAVVSANFAPTDTTCSAAATGGTVYALGTCIPSGTNNGFILTADSSGTIYRAAYASSSCSGSPQYSYAQSKTPCKCTSTGCSSGYYYTPNQPSLAGTFYAVYQYIGANCEASGAPYAISAAVTTSCGTSTCQSSTSNGITTSYKTTCSTAQLGSITTGYAVQGLYSAKDTSCSTPTFYYALPLGVCGYNSYASGLYNYFTADSNGAIYWSTYAYSTSSNPCSGSPLQGTLFSNGGGCTCTSSGCSKTFYSASLPTLPGSSSVQTTTAYTGSSCSSGTASSLYIYPYTGTSCTPATCITSGSYPVSVTCSGSTAGTTTGAGSLTTGYGVASMYFAGSDSTCSGVPTNATLYALGSCIPTTSSSGATNGGLLLSSDSTGTIYYASYSSASCTGSSSTPTALQRQGCTCASSVNGVCQAYTNGFYYTPTVPTIQGQQAITVTTYTGSSCTSSVAYVVTMPTSYCYSSGCSTTSSGTAYQYTCSGTTTGKVTTGYVLATATYASSDTSCVSPNTVVYYPVGQCLPQGSGGVIFTADVAPTVKTYYAAYATTTCSGTPTTNYAYPTSTCQASATGLASNFTYVPTLPSVAGAYTQTIQYYTGSSCSPSSLRYGYIMTIPAGSTCYSAPCTTDSAGNSYTYTCSGAGGTPTAYPSSMPIVAGSPTAGPTSEVNVAVSISLTLEGISSSEFSGNAALQAQVQSILAQAYPGSQASSFALTVAPASGRKLASPLGTALLTGAKLANVMYRSTMNQPTANTGNANVNSPSFSTTAGGQLAGAGTTTVKASATNVAKTVSPVAEPVSIPAGGSSGGVSVGGGGGGGGSSNSGGGGSCFAASELVTLESGATKAIADVAVGDRILTVNARTGAFVYSDVAYVPHGKNTVQATFVTVATASGRDVKMTADHVLPAGACEAPAALPYASASAVSVGDCVETVSGRERVVSVSTVVGAGIYTAIAMEELLVVNGIVATPYGGVNPALANVYYNLHRLAYQVAHGSSASASASLPSSWAQAATEGLWGLLSRLAAAAAPSLSA